MSFPPTWQVTGQVPQMQASKPPVQPGEMQAQKDQKETRKKARHDRYLNKDLVPDPKTTVDDCISFVANRMGEIESEEICKFVRCHPDLGLWALISGIWSHRRSTVPTPLFDRWGWLVCTCLVLTFFVQLVIPFAIFTSSFQQYYRSIYGEEDDFVMNHGEKHYPEEIDYAERYLGAWFCPPKRAKEKQKQVVMCSIALMYFARLTILAIKKGSGEKFSCFAEHAHILAKKPLKDVF